MNLLLPASTSVPPRGLRLPVRWPVALQHQSVVSQPIHDLGPHLLNFSRGLSQSVVTFHGTFRGVTREIGYFDFLTDEGILITGRVADYFTEEDLERIDALTNQ